MNQPETKKDQSAESVADLPVSSEQADEIQAGAETKGKIESFAAFPGFTGGVFVASGDVN